MSNLKEYLELCKMAYYSGRPIISDSQYDHLEEICSEDLSIGTNAGRVKHIYKMYSLKKIYVGEEGSDFDASYYEDTPKLDGAAVALRYMGGLFDCAVTRGNGEYGELIEVLNEKLGTDKLYIPHQIPVGGVVQINGEVVAPKHIDNARNYASGALNLDDIEEFYNRDLTFFAYDMQESELKSYSGTLHYLKDIGFKTVRDRSVSSYPQDGRVFRVESNEQYKKLGFTSKHPRGAFALKERSEGVKTKVLDVTWQTGKSGKVTPVAILEPINIDGATVSRATLNNVGFIEALGLRIGDSVFVERAGGIIPRIIRKAE